MESRRSLFAKKLTGTTRNGVEVYLEDILVPDQQNCHLPVGLVQNLNRWAKVMLERCVVLMWRGYLLIHHPHRCRDLISLPHA